MDGGLFTGPATAPTWQKDDVPTDYASAITAVMADGGRDTPTATDPQRRTPTSPPATELAADLGLPATKVDPRQRAGRRQAAGVRPVGDLRRSWSTRCCRTPTT